MNTRKHRLLTLILISFGITISLTGCATTETQNAASQPTMVQAYQSALRGGGSSLRRERYSVSTHENLTSHANLGAAPPSANQIVSGINAKFPMLPNPPLIIYIAGHYAGKSQAPVPGYYTVIPMYKHNHYMLPGDIGA